MSIESRPACKLVRPSAGEAAYNLNYFPGISAESAGATGICLQVLKIPPGGKAEVHLHEGPEMAGYVISGQFGL